MGRWGKAMKSRFHQRAYFVLCCALVYSNFVLGASAATTQELSSQQIKKIGTLIWTNEALGRKDLLVFWNKTLETFPSFGIGHFIWYPEGITRPFTESFPALCTFLEKQNVVLPKWLKKALSTGAPWKTRQELLDDTKRTDELRELLAATVVLQTTFMIQNLANEWPLMIKAAPKSQRKKLIKNFELLRASELGTYALIDYCNFKGSGLNPQETCDGKGWGLLQVLLDMPGELTVETAPKAFTVSATKMLVRLIEDSAPDYRRVNFFAGWMKRVSTYANQKLFNEGSKQD